MMFVVLDDEQFARVRALAAEFIRADEQLRTASPPKGSSSRSLMAPGEFVISDTEDGTAG